MFSPILADVSFTRSSTVFLSSLTNGCSSRQILVELVQLAVDDLVDDVGGLASRLRTAPRRSRAPAPIAPPALPRGGRVGAGRGDVHREVLAQGLEVVGARHEVGLAVDLDEHADAAAVDVGVDEALRGGAVGRFSALAIPDLRSSSTAFSMSPPSPPAPSCSPSCRPRCCRAAA